MRPMRETVWKTRQGSQPKTEVEHGRTGRNLFFFLNEERRVAHPLPPAVVPASPSRAFLYIVPLICLYVEHN